MESFIQTYGQYKTIVDGNIIDNAKWNVVYDGDVLDLEAEKNNESMYVQLTNDEIMKLFEIPSSNKTIHDRLEYDLHHPIQPHPIVMEEITIQPEKTTPIKKHKSRKSKSKSKSKSKFEIKQNLTKERISLQCVVL